MRIQMLYTMSVLLLSTRIVQRPRRPNDRFNALASVLPYLVVIIDTTLDILWYKVPGLAKGAAYHVRVSAYNGVALSYGRTAPSNVPVVRPGEAPEPPSRVEVEAFSPSSLAISWSPPNDAMGSDVTSYQVVSERETVFTLNEGCVCSVPSSVVSCPSLKTKSVETASRSESS